MSLLSAFFPSKPAKAVELMHETTERQIAEAKALVAGVSEVKEKLVTRANGALYELKAKRGGGHEGESKA